MSIRINARDDDSLINGNVNVSSSNQNSFGRTRNTESASTHFIQAFNRLNDQKFSDEFDLLMLRNEGRDIELPNSRWREIVEILINEILECKFRHGNSEASDENEVHDHNEMALTINLEQEQPVQSNLWGEGEKQLVPFEIGMEMLRGNNNLNMTKIDHETKQKMRKIQADAEKMASERIQRDQRYSRLFREKEHWKYLARTRLAELDNELQFRYQVAFGNNGQD